MRIPEETWKILVVDDDEDVQLVTRLVLEDFSFLDRSVHLLSARSEEEGIAVVRDNPDIAVSIIDVVMETRQAGLDLVRRIREELGNRMMRIILRTGQPGAAPEKEVVIRYDINDYKEKSELTYQKLETSVITALRSYSDLRIIEETQRAIIMSLGEAIDMRSCETGEHVFRVSVLSRMIALEMGMPEHEAERLALISPMHDVGKITIPDAILGKPGKLTVLEYEQMKAHTFNGYKLLAHSSQALLREAAVIALQHHERHDGNGYPNGICGDEIAVNARIVALVDVFDALVSDRVYKKAWPLEQAVDYIREQRGRQFHPDVVDAFLGIPFDRLREMGSRGLNDGMLVVPDVHQPAASRILTAAVEQHSGADAEGPLEEKSSTTSTDDPPWEPTVAEMTANLEAIMNNSHDAIIIHSPDGRFLHVNERMLQMYGCSRRKALSLSVPDISTETNSMDLVHIYWNKALAGKTAAFEWQCRNVGDGTVFPVSVSLVRFIWRGQQAIMATVRDISDFKEAQERIRRSEERLEMAMYVTSQGVWDYSITDNAVVYDRRCYEMAGYGFEEFPNCETEWASRVQEEDQVEMMKNLERFFAGETTVLEAEYRFTRKDGGIMWIHAIGKVVERDAAGKPLRIVGTNEDVTDRVKAENELLRQRVYTNAVMDSVPGLLYLYDAEGHLVRWNKRHEEVTGYSAEELSHMTLTDWYRGNPTDWDHILVAVQKAFVDGYAEEEGHLTMKDGRQVLFHFNAVRLELDGLMYIAGIGLDVTEQHLVNQRLRDSEERYRLLFETISHGFLLAEIITDENGKTTDYRYLDVNPAFCRMAGQPAETFIGRRGSEIYPTEYRYWLEENGDIALHGGTANHEGLSAQIGRYFDTVVFQAKPGQFAALLSDSTEKIRQKQALEAAMTELSRVNETLEDRVLERTAQLEQANRELEDRMEELKLTQDELIRSERLASLGELVAGIAHEINTPIGVGVTAGSFLESYVKEFRTRHRNEALAPDIEKFIAKCEELSKMILSNLERAAKLIKGFKQVSVDRTHDVERVINLKDYVDEILVSLAPAMKKSPHRLVNAIGSEVWLNVYPGALSQILTNLTMNALQHGFSPDMSGVAEVDALDEGDAVSILFRDNGSGMSSEVRQHIFDPFFTTKRGEGGSGLGLFIVHNLVTNQLKGTIDCRTSPDEGTEYRIRIPKKPQ